MLQEWPDLVRPEQVDDFFVGENRVRGRAAAAHQHDEKKCGRSPDPQAPTLDYGAWRHRDVPHGLNAAEYQKNDNDDTDYTHTAGRGITPIPAMRPTRQRPEKRQNQDHDQNRSKHGLLLIPCQHAVQLIAKLHREGPLQRDVDGNSLARVVAVVQVVAVIHIVDVNIVVVVPVVPPLIWPRVNRTDPVALVLEARVSAYNQEGKAVDAEVVAGAKVSAVPVIRNAVATVAATLLPRAVIGLPVL